MAQAQKAGAKTQSKHPAGQKKGKMPKRGTGYVLGGDEPDLPDDDPHARRELMRAAAERRLAAMQAARDQQQQQQQHPQQHPQQPHQLPTTPSEKKPFPEGSSSVNATSSSSLEPSAGTPWVLPFAPIAQVNDEAVDDFVEEDEEQEDEAEEGDIEADDVIDEDLADDRDDALALQEAIQRSLSEQ
jgi:hypothetical protein